MAKFDHPMPSVPSPTREAPLVRVSSVGLSHASRTIIDECPVAVVLNGTTVAVMMTSPLHIEDFALGFAVSEGYIHGPADVETFEIVAHDAGVEARFWVTDPCADALKERRRAMLGPIGCGLCGIDSLEAAIRPVARVEANVQLTAAALQQGFEYLRDDQHLHNATRSCHAAAFLTPGDGLVAVREDVGRHNALDKLIGCLLKDGVPPAHGAIIMTSRISVELVQKSASVGCGMLCGVSGPSALAVETATQAGMTLTGFNREEGFDVFSEPWRIIAA